MSTNSIKILLITKATPANQLEWDSFVQTTPNTSPYHMFAWGTAITEAYGHKPYYLMAKQNSKLLGILPLIHLKLPFVINQLVALPFCDVGNCLTTDKTVQEKLLEEALKLTKHLKSKNIQLRGQLKNDNNLTTPITKIDHKKVRMLLDLPESTEVLLKSFKSKLRSQVRKAEKNGVHFRWTGEEGVDSFYSVFCSNMRDLGSPVHSKKLFQAIIENFGVNSRIGLAEYDGKCIGAGLILSTNTQTSIPWASTLRQYNNLAPNMLIYWNCLKYATENSKNVFDFGRSTEHEGTFRFKKQWGAKPVPLSWYAFPPHMPEPHQESQSITSRRETLANIWKTLPIPIANLVGPKLRKYISL